MLINFFCGIKSQEMPDQKIEISRVGQLIECIRDGYIPCINYTEMTDFLYEMMNGNFAYKGIVEAIQNHYFYDEFFMEYQGIMVFKRFLETGVLSFQNVD